MANAAPCETDTCLGAGLDGHDLRAPIRVTPVFRQYIWGGRRLETVLGKSIGAGEHFAESWEIVDRADAQSVVAEGPNQGKTLRELIERQPGELVGADSVERLPLLLKFLDCQRDLSVQVHPDDSYARRLDPPDLGKTEAWYVVHTEPGSRLFVGLRHGVTLQTFREAVQRGELEACLHVIEPNVGDCFFIPAGTVHALGAGLIVAEIQQSSDVTFRLFDWNRVDSAGKSRPLHIEQGLEVTDFERGPVAAQQPAPGRHPGSERLVTCSEFLLERWTWGNADHDAERSWSHCGRFHFLAVVAGAVTIRWHGSSPTETHEMHLRLGESVFIPAALDSMRLIGAPDTVLLDAYPPPRTVH